MEGNVLYVRNMVCDRCIWVVRNQLEQAGLHPLRVELGQVVLHEDLTEAVRGQVKSVLEPFGFELIDDKKTQLNEQLKTAIITVVHRQDNGLRINLSDYLAGLFHRDYSVLSKLFSELNHTTIEKYFIAQKIERVKELLVYGELSLSEIAFKLNYSSVAHLSAQFKSVTGLTPSHFKEIGVSRRKALDGV